MLWAMLDTVEQEMRERERDAQRLGGALDVLATLREKLGGLEECEPASEPLAVSITIQPIR